VRIELSDEIEQLVAAKVASGKYGSTDEVLHQALHLLDLRDTELEALQSDAHLKIEEGWQALRHGVAIDGEEFFSALEGSEKALKRKTELSGE